MAWKPFLFCDIYQMRWAKKIFDFVFCLINLIALQFYSLNEALNGTIRFYPLLTVPCLTIWLKTQNILFPNMFDNFFCVDLIKVWPVGKSF